MTDIVEPWIVKAHNDFKAGNDQMATDEPATDTVCFHMQQCVEKYLKGYLVFHRVGFRKTHDIAELIELCKTIRPEFDDLYKFDADSLTIYAAEVRYPDDFYMPTPDEARESINIALKVMNFVKDKLEKDGYVFPDQSEKRLALFNLV